MTTDAHHYVYAVMRAGDLDGFADATAGLAAVDAPEATLETLVCGELASVVSPVEADEVLATRRNMMAHARALETLATLGPLLPMRFGLIAPGAAAARAAISAETDAIQHLIGVIDGADEYVVRITWRREAAMSEIVEADPSLKNAYLSLAGKPEAATRDARIALGRRVAAAIETARLELSSRFYADLGALARDAAREDPEDDMMALKAAFLVDRSHVGAFSAALEALEAEKAGRFDVKLVGPGPAYSFSKVTLRWSAAGALAQAV